MNKFTCIVLAWGMSVLALQAQEVAKDSVELEDVVVTGARYEATARNLPFTLTTVSQQRLQETERTAILPTLSEAVPGLFVTQRGMMGFGVSSGAAGGINLRGLSSTGQVLVLIDGQPQYQGIFGHSISDAYQTLMVDRVEVIRGPASVLYGSNAMGGVINLITRGKREQGVRTHLRASSGSYGTVQTEGSVDMRFGQFTSDIAIQYGRTDNHREDMAFEQYGGMLKLGYDCSDHWSVGAQGQVTHFNSANPGPVSAPLLDCYQWITRGSASLEVSNRYKRVNGRVSVYDNFGVHCINDGHEVGAPAETKLFRSQDHLLGVSAYETMSLFTGSYITLGVDYKHIIGHAWYTHIVTNEEVPSGKMATSQATDEAAGYIHVRQDLGRWVSLNAGVRYDYHSVAGGQWIPEVSVITHPMVSAQLKATASRGFRNPTIKDMYLYAVANADSLKAESIWNYELSWNHTLQKVTYGANVYLLHGDNMIQALGSPKKLMNTGKLMNLGVEAEVSVRFNEHWSLESNHSYIHMWHKLLATPQYKGYVGARMQYGKWTANLGVQELWGIYTSLGANPTLSQATLVNARVAFQACEQVKLWIKGDNLLNQKYETYAGYPMVGITCMAGVNVNF